MRRNDYIVIRVEATGEHLVFDPSFLPYIEKALVSLSKNGHAKVLSEEDTKAA